MKMSQRNFLYPNKKCLFFKNGEQEGKTSPVWELAPVGGGGYR
jgi:hypothetical protein